MAMWAGLSETCGPGKLMWLEEGDQAEIGGQAEIGEVVRSTLPCMRVV